MAGFTSAQPRVLQPQSGFTQSLSLGRAAAAWRSRPTISSTPGARGEWMSHRPGPMALG